MKKRIDVLLMERNLAETRSRAQALILSGLVFIEGKRVDKAGMMFEEDSNIRVNKRMPYVSRGAYKLKEAYEKFDLDFKDKIVVDVGSSTGGFTDFAILKGARKVFAIDVGKGQLAEKLRKDLRVEVMEETDFRSVEKLGKVDFFVVDVSFISLKKIIPKIAALRSEGSQAVLLIKPQFEVGKKEASRGKGIIKNETLRENVINEIIDFARALDFEILGITTSPIKGAKGNIEYLLWLNCSQK